MKPGIHPEYVDATVHCSCGHNFTTKSTRANIRVDVCSNCHPFYTGTAGRLVDAAGQVERFNRRFKIKNETTK